ncbi:hypothetical protein [Pseudoxanthomonas winnipegensis]|uniref:Uncharacterized protein n=1 Tax=Pseudoxanthomonas winnipegensis TaxID=2480810 RepID=A0A4Q8LCG7_9GAMM|nr:hypothetical protein [Pseudoxanthomonas winnipegensis]TAA26567.1 hypothetical protein EA660_04865 [Pseudoxanthomonas winnipegensis]
MTTLFRNSAGTDLDDVFDPYVQGTKPGATAFRTSDGTDLNQRYAPLAYGSQAAATGFRLANGSDVNTLWAKKGTASYALGFNGKSYSATGARTGLHGGSTATVALTIRADGTWEAREIGTTGSGNVAGSGQWLVAGESAAACQVRFEYTAQGNGSWHVTRTAEGFTSLGSDQNITAQASGAAEDVSGASGTFTCYLKRPNGVVSVSTCNWTVTAN